eukprot:TRINITY_DN152_c0_g2_i1.p1 TRINITY_DN152_c0_g2~~TRINITY_DN152_c0_g2_i1.p1  ORF type:complete len:1933 (-),score=373.41 TRINITY_DN152_c0_g2_i1:82-5880(-)
MSLTRKSSNLTFTRRTHAALCLQRVSRGWVERRKFLDKKRKTILIQRAYRVHFRRRAEKLRESEEKHQNALNAAIEANDLDRVISTLDALVENLLVEFRRPIPPLITSAIVGSTKLVTFLYENGYDLNALDQEGQSALDRACGSDHPEVVQLLLHLGAKSGKSHDGKCAMHWSAQAGGTTVLEYLAKAGMDVNVQDADGCTPLHLACYAGAIDSVKTLLKLGADVHAGTAHDTSLLVWAIAGRSLPILQLLHEEHGLDLNVKDSAQRNLYHHCALKTIRGDICQYLFKHIPGHDDPDVDGTRPLMQAAESGNVDVTQLLLDKGVEVNARDHGGRSALHYAATSYAVNAPACSQLLCENGLDPGIRDNDQAAAIHFSAAYGTAFFLNAQLKRSKSAARMRDGNGRTAVHWAVSGGHVNILKLLHPVLPHLNPCDRHGLSPYDCLMDCPDDETRQETKAFLLQHGAKPGKTIKRAAIKLQALTRGYLVRSDGPASLESSPSTMTLDDSDNSSMKSLDLLLTPRSSRSTPHKSRIRAPSIGKLYKGQLKSGAHVAPEEYQALCNKFIETIKKKDADVSQVADLIDHGADVNARDVDGRTALHFASEFGEKDIIELALSHGADATALTYDTCETPLITAARAGHHDVIEPLVSGEAGLSVVNHRDSSGNTALHWAALEQHSPVIAALAPLPEVEIDALDAQDRTALLISASQDDHRSVDSLLFSHANVNFVQPGTGKTALHYATAGSQAKAVQSLVKHGADPTLPDAHGHTVVDLAVMGANQLPPEIQSAVLKDEAPLHSAIFVDDYFTFTGHLTGSGKKSKKLLAHIHAGETVLMCATRYDRPDFVRAIIASNQVDVNTKSTAELYPGYTALHYAVETNSETCVKLLVSEPTIVTGIRDEQGRTPLALAVEKGNHKIANMLLDSNLLEALKQDDVEMLQSVLDLGASVTRRRNHGCCAFLSAAKAKAEKCIVILGQSGARVDAFDQNLNNALHLAATHKAASIIPIALDMGCDLEARNTDFMTPLHSAVAAGDLQAVKHLIRAGASVTCKDIKGRIPLQVAKLSGQSDLVQAVLRGYPPIHAAVVSSDLEKLNHLLKMGTDPNTCHEGVSVLTVCTKVNFVEGIAPLLQEGADPNAVDPGNGWTTLHYAVSMGNVATVTELVARRANIGAVARETRQTPVHLAVESGAYSVLRALLSADRSGASSTTQSSEDQHDTETGTPPASASRATRSSLGTDDKLTDILNSRDDDGSTALHIATRHAYEDCVAYLMQHGASCEVYDKRHRLPLHNAALSGCLSAVTLICEECSDCIESMLTQRRDKYRRTVVDSARKAGFSQIVTYLDNLLAKHPGDTRECAMPPVLCKESRSRSVPNAKSSANSFDGSGLPRVDEDGEDTGVDVDEGNPLLLLGGKAPPVEEMHTAPAVASDATGDKPLSKTRTKRRHRRRKSGNASTSASGTDKDLQDAADGTAPASKGQKDSTASAGQAVVVEVQTSPSSPSTRSPEEGAGGQSVEDGHKTTVANTGPDNNDSDNDNTGHTSQSPAPAHTTDTRAEDPPASSAGPSAAPASSSPPPPPSSTGKSKDKQPARGKPGREGSPVGKGSKAGNKKDVRGKKETTSASKSKKKESKNKPRESGAEVDRPPAPISARQGNADKDKDKGTHKGKGTGVTTTPIRNPRAVNVVAVVPPEDASHPFYSPYNQCQMCGAPGCQVHAAELAGEEGEVERGDLLQPLPRELTMTLAEFEHRLRLRAAGRQAPNRRKKAQVGLLVPLRQQQQQQQRERRGKEAAQPSSPSSVPTTPSAAATPTTTPRSGKPAPLAVGPHSPYRQRIPRPSPRTRRLKTRGRGPGGEVGADGPVNPTTPKSAQKGSRANNSGAEEQGKDSHGDKVDNAATATTTTTATTDTAAAGGGGGGDGTTSESAVGLHEQEAEATVAR